MPKFPEPPSGAGELAARVAPEGVSLPPGTMVWRIYHQGGAHPGAWNSFRHWGPSPRMRFDHHTPPACTQARGILYGAEGPHTCFAEVFQDTRSIERGRDAPWLVGFKLVCALTLLDLTATWPTRAGASMAIASGRRDRARRWSLRIYEDYPAIDGLCYPSSMAGNANAVALYERAGRALPAAPTFHRALADPALDGVVAQASQLFRYPVTG